MANETKNVKISFEERVRTQLESGQSLTIDWEGTLDDPAHVAEGADAKTEFVRVRSLGFTPSPTRNGDRRELWTFQFDINVLVGFDRSGTPVNTTHRKWEMFDLIEAAFGQHDLAVLDYASDQSELFRLRFGEGALAPVGGGGPAPEDPELPRWERSAATYEAWLID